MVRPIDLSVHDYHRQLLRWYDQCIRLTATSSYWFAIPLFLGASVVLYYPALRLLPGPWGLALLALLFLALSGYCIATSVRAVADLRRRKSEVQGLLEEMDRA
jgi:hypothetical protein